jgi:hypothetical protein
MAPNRNRKICQFGSNDVAGDQICHARSTIRMKIWIRDFDYEPEYEYEMEPIVQPS